MHPKYMPFPPPQKPFNLLDKLDGEIVPPKKLTHKQYQEVVSSKEPKLQLKDTILELEPWGRMFDERPPSPRHEREDKLFSYKFLKQNLAHMG